MLITLRLSFSITNLKYWGGNEAIISRTLTLLSELSVGYSSVRKLVKLDTVQFVLSNHTVSYILLKCCKKSSSLSKCSSVMQSLKEHKMISLCES